jgi:hypothetical protein
MANSPADTIVACEKCSDSIFCSCLNPYRCNGYIPALSSNFMIETHIPADCISVLEEVI